MIIHILITVDSMGTKRVRETRQETRLRGQGTGHTAHRALI